MPLVMFGVKEQSNLRWLVVLRVRRSSPRRVDRIRQGPMRHDLAAPGIVLRRGRGNSWQPSCQAKQSQCQRAHGMKSAIAKLAVFIGADSRFDLR
jgi:hypothetical protein